MEQAFAAKVVDDGIPGPWPRVQVNLGLKQESDFSPNDFTPQFYKNLEAAKLLRNPSHEVEDLPLPYSDINRSWASMQPPPKFGQGFLDVPRAQPLSTSQGFGAGTNKRKKKKKK